MAGAHPSPLVNGITRRKLLKRERLQVFRFGPKVPFFRQVIWLAKIGNTLGHLLRNAEV
jgi:hypothetical protein